MADLALESVTIEFMRAIVVMRAAASFTTSSLSTSAAAKHSGSWASRVAANPPIALSIMRYLPPGTHWPPAASSSRARTSRIG